MKAKECMCNDVCCVKPNATVYDVAKLMNDNHIGCVPVCNNENSVCGIVTDRDIILRSIVNNKNVKETPISEIMSCNVCTCNENDEINTVEDKMSKNQIRRIPVCDSQNKIVGILTLGDLANNSKEVGEKNVCTTLENICDCNSNSKNAK